MIKTLTEQNGAKKRGENQKNPVWQQPQIEQNLFNIDINFKNKNFLSGVRY